MSQLSSRIIVMPLRQAWPWRWEMAMLELACRQSWRLPSAEVLAQRARRLGEALQCDLARAALGFDGYTLVGACWRGSGNPAIERVPAIDAFGPYVMPSAAVSRLGPRLLEALAGNCS